MKTGTVLGGVAIFAVFGLYFVGCFASMPEVQVDGPRASSVSFGDWKRDRRALEGTLTYRGGGLTDLRYTEYSAEGVKLDEAPVAHPSLAPGESAKVRLYLDDDAKRVVIVAE